MSYWWPPEGWEPSTLQLDAVDHAIAVAGRLVGNGPGDQVWRDACFPGEKLVRIVAYEKKHVYACALTAACYLRCLGVEDTEDTPHKFRLAPPYVDQMAMSRLTWHGHHHDAMQDVCSLPDAGDICIIGEDGDDGKSGGPGHAFLVTSVPVDGNVIHSIDGGSGKISRVERKVLLKGGRLWLRDHYFTRRLNYVIRPTNMRMTGVFILPPEKS